LKNKQQPIHGLSALILSLRGRREEELLFSPLRRRAKMSSTQFFLKPLKKRTGRGGFHAGLSLLIRLERPHACDCVKKKIPIPKILRRFCSAGVSQDFSLYYFSLSLFSSSVKKREREERERREKREERREKREERREKREKSSLTPMKISKGKKLCFTSLRSSLSPFLSRPTHEKVPPSSSGGAVARRGAASWRCGVSSSAFFFLALLLTWRRR